MSLCRTDDPIAHINPDFVVSTYTFTKNPVQINENVLFNTCVQVEMEPFHLSLLFLTVNVPKKFSMFLRMKNLQQNPLGQIPPQRSSHTQGVYMSQEKLRIR